MKNKIIIILISIIIFSMSYNIYNLTTSNYEYKNVLQKKMESFKNTNARMDKCISDSSNNMYYNLDYIKMNL